MGKNTKSVPMKDLIDERNEWERISKSIIKSWNVNYVPRQPELPPEESVRRRSEAEAAVENEKTYNATTGSHSGAYGRQEIKDEVTKGQIDKILQEKSESLRQLIDESK